MPLHTDLLPLLFSYYYRDNETPLLRAARRFMTHESAWRALRRLGPELYQDILFLFPNLAHVIPRRIVVPAKYPMPLFGAASVILFRNRKSIYNQATQKTLSIDPKSSFVFSREDIYMLIKTSDRVLVHRVDTLANTATFQLPTAQEFAVNDFGEIAYATDHGGFTVRVAGRDIVVANFFKLIDGPSGSFIAVMRDGIVVINRHGERANPIYFNEWQRAFDATWVGDSLAFMNDNITRFIYDETQRVFHDVGYDKVYLKNGKLEQIEQNCSILRFMKNRVIVASVNPQAKSLFYFII